MPYLSCPTLVEYFKVEIWKIGVVLFARALVNPFSTFFLD
jgi:hypothetical protein